MENLRRLRLKKHMTQVALQMETGIPRAPSPNTERAPPCPRRITWRRWRRIFTPAWIT